MRLLRKGFIPHFFSWNCVWEKMWCFCPNVELRAAIFKEKWCYCLSPPAVLSLRTVPCEGRWYFDLYPEEFKPTLVCIFRHPHGLFIPLCHQAYLQPWAVLGPCLQRGYSVYGLWEVMGCCNFLDPQSKWFWYIRRLQPVNSGSVFIQQRVLMFCWVRDVPGFRHQHVLVCLTGICERWFRSHKST